MLLRARFRSCTEPARLLAVSLSALRSINRRPLSSANRADDNFAGAAAGPACAHTTARPAERANKRSIGLEHANGRQTPVRARAGARRRGSRSIQQAQFNQLGEQSVFVCRRQ